MVTVKKVVAKIVIELLHLVIYPLLTKLLVKMEDKIENVKNELNSQILTENEAKVKIEKACPFHLLGVAAK